MDQRCVVPGRGQYPEAEGQRERKVLIRKSQETVGDKQNKTRHLEWGVKLRSWRAETDHGELRSMQDGRRT